MNETNPLEQQPYPAPVDNSATQNQPYANNYQQPYAAPVDNSATQNQPYANNYQQPYTQPYIDQSAQAIYETPNSPKKINPKIIILVILVVVSLLVVVATTLFSGSSQKILKSKTPSIELTDYKDQFITIKHPSNLTNKPLYSTERLFIDNTDETQYISIDAATNTDVAIGDPAMINPDILAKQKEILKNSTSKTVESVIEKTGVKTKSIYTENKGGVTNTQLTFLYYPDVTWVIIFKYKDKSPIFYTKDSVVQSFQMVDNNIKKSNNTAK